MLIDDIRERLEQRLVAWETTAKSEFIKKRLATRNISGTYLDQLLYQRKTDRSRPIPTITKLEDLASALQLSLPWLLLGIGRPEEMFDERSREGAFPIGGAKARGRRSAKDSTTKRSKFS